MSFEVGGTPGETHAINAGGFVHNLLAIAFSQAFETEVAVAGAHSGTPKDAGVEGVAQTAVIIKHRGVGALVVGLVLGCAFEGEIDG